MNSGSGVLRHIFWVFLFGISFALVEASVVVYLRALYYPGGFSLPLKVIPAAHLSVELAREFATIVMLAAVGMMAGKRRWERFGYFIIAFGSWDIFYYVWLKVMLDWPAKLTDWDILFLLPIPWIGPVIAPVVISLAMVVAGCEIVGRVGRGMLFQPGILSWLLACLATGIILVSFMMDTPATLEGKMPQPYRYEFFVVGMIVYGISMWLAVKKPGRAGANKSGRA